MPKDIMEILIEFLTLGLDKKERCTQIIIMNIIREYVIFEILIYEQNAVVTHIKIMDITIFDLCKNVCVILQ